MATAEEAAARWRRYAPQKLCGRCGRPIHFAGPPSRGQKNRRRNHCIECWPIYQAERMRRKDRAKALRSYGLTAETFEALLVSQSGRCAICSTAEPGGKGNQWHVDHDSETGRIRGILCALCNPGIGYLGHDIKRLRAAIRYLS